MNIWLISLLIAVIAILITALFFTVKGNIRLQKELDISLSEEYRLMQESNRNFQEIKCLEKQLSFQEGLRIARKTDTLYQQILKKCSGNEQFTVMMNGTQEGDKE